MEPQSEPWNPAPRCTDLNKTRRYTETYEHDPVGNMLQLRHGINGNGFTRKFDLQDGSNRLASVTVGNEPGGLFRYTHDANGNLSGETTSRHFEWDHSDQLKTFRTEAANGNPSLHAHHLYDAGGTHCYKAHRHTIPGRATPDVKFHLADHLGSSTTVIDHDGACINREEYTPYGETIFGSFSRKRYRFTGKERWRRGPR